MKNTFTRKNRQYPLDPKPRADKFDIFETALSLGLLTFITLLSVYAVGGVL